MPLDNPIFGDITAPSGGLTDAGRKAIAEAATKTNGASKPALSDEDTGRLSASLTGYKDVIAADRANVDSKAPKPPVISAPPPEHAVTDPLQAFGQPAMWLATFGSLLSRNHLTTAIQAAAGVMEATHKLDEEGAKQKYDAWKVSTENAVKMAKYEMDTYNAAIKKLDVDSKAGKAELETSILSFKNEALQHIYDTEGPAGVAKWLKMGKASVDGMQAAGDGFTGVRAKDKEFYDIAVDDFTKQFGRPPKKGDATDNVALARLKLHAEAANTAESAGLRTGATAAAKPSTEAQKTTKEDDDAANIAWNQKHPGEPFDPDAATDLQRAEYYKLRHDAVEKRKQETTPVKPSEAGDRREEDSNRADAAWLKAHPGEPPYNAATATPDQRAEYATLKDAAAKERGANRALEGTTASDRRLIDEEIRRAHPELRPGQVVDERIKQAAADKVEHEKVSPEVVVTEAHRFRATGLMGPLGRSNQTARRQIMEEVTRELRAEGTSVGEDIARGSDLKALQGTLIKLGQSKAAVANFEGTAMKEADLTLKLSKAGVAGGTPMINRWIQAKRQSINGDPEVIAFDAALVSFKNEYARIMSSPTATGGVTSDSARHEADELINIEMTQRGVEAAIRTMKIGMENRVNSINDEYDATKTRITQLGEFGGDKGKPAAASQSHQEGDTTTSKSGRPMIYKGGTWQYQQQ